MDINKIINKTGDAESEYYTAKDMIFAERSKPLYYFQIIEGEVKLSNYGEDGKEIIQEIIEAGQSISTFMLFMDKTYPVNAIALTSCIIMKIDKNRFLDLLENNPEIYAAMTGDLSNAMYFKFVMGQVISSQSPATKLTILMDYLKSLQKDLHPFSFKIPLTRQQMASLTGLCVETAIRTIKNMERENIIKIFDGKIFY
ncbi:Crp/Fnr family transcriptional regulator [Epilithonimonas sp.]|uniref:Crp/Fnr family transcriptional regulator n=1 Tax=Epilithonimonas sp. TaxID=2894511 RepID=UPI00289C1365|nr:Crp/Fnr family transcriptional regulator [Epilithonimonas sp.]